MKFPTQDLTQRLLQNGGRVPFGLFRPNQWRARPRNPSAGPVDQVARLIAELRNMLRDLTNLNVRQPSHMAPPFRAQQWSYQVYLDTDATDPVTIPIGGNSVVPTGSLGVIVSLMYVGIPPYSSGSILSPLWGEAAAVPATLTLYRNSQAISGLDAIRPSFTRGNQASVGGVDFNVQTATMPPLPIIPVPLLQGDSLTYTTTNLGTGNAYLQVMGYTYPIEHDGDGVRGTLADRG